MSVVIPTFDRGHYLEEAIDSVLGQTFESLEVIVVDDASTDDTPARLARYGDRLRVIRFDRNRGNSAARNAGIAVARGELLAFLDSDDAWFPDKLERQVARLDGEPGLDCLTGGLQCIDEAGAWLSATMPPCPAPEPIVVDMAGVIAYSPGQPSSLIIRASAATAIGAFDEKMRCEDTDYYLRVARHLRFVHDPRVVGCYRVHGGNISRWGPGVARGDMDLFAKWASVALPRADALLVRRRLGMARYRLAVLELDSAPRARVAGLFAAAALGDPLVDGRMPGRPTSVPARVWQITKPWVAAAACLLGVAAPLRGAGR